MITLVDLPVDRVGHSELARDWRLRVLAIGRYVVLSEDKTVLFQGTDVG